MDLDSHVNCCQNAKRVVVLRLSFLRQLGGQGRAGADCVHVAPLAVSAAEKSSLSERVCVLAV